MANKIIHVRRDVIARNKKTGGDDAPLVIRNGRRGKAELSHRIEIRDPVTKEVLVAFVYTPGRPLSCGAVVYAEVSENMDVRSVTHECGGCGQEDRPVADAGVPRS